MLVAGYDISSAATLFLYILLLLLLAAVHRTPATRGLFFIANS